MRTDQPLFPRWVLIAVPALAVAALVVTLVVAALGDDEASTGSADLAAVSDDIRAQAQAAGRAAGGDEEVERLGRRLEVLADIAEDDPAVDPPSWGERGLAPGAALQGAGTDFEAQVSQQQSPRQRLRWLLLAEAGRARHLGLDDLATGIERVVEGLAGA